MLFYNTNTNHALDSMLYKKCYFIIQMIVIQQYFLSAKKERQSEIDLCLQNNLCCQFDHIVLLNEQPYTLDHFNNTQKLMVVDDYAERLTFYDAFQYANNHYADGTIVIVSNSDIL